MAGLLGNGRPGDGLYGNQITTMILGLLAPKVMGGMVQRDQAQAERAAAEEERRRKEQAMKAGAGLASELVRSKMVGPYADPKMAFKESLLPLQEALPAILRASGQGYDPSGLLETYRAIDGNEVKRMEAQRGVVVAAGNDLVNPMVKNGLLHRTPNAPYTIGPGEERRDSNNQLVASVAPKVELHNASPQQNVFQLGGGQAPSGAPRGVRNNNPGNIEDGPFARGLPGYKGSDGRFAVFENMDQGKAAAARLLQSYGQRGINTPAAVIERWAPAKENGASTNNYAASVAQAMGVRPGDRIDLSNPQVASRMAEAMFTFENGGAVSGGSGPRVIQQGTAAPGMGEPPAASGLTKLGNGFYRDKIGRVYQQGENGKMAQTTGVTDTVVAKTTETITGANDILSSLDRFDEAVRQLSPKDWGPFGQYVGDPAKFASAKAAATDLQMRLKGPAGYNLGVLAGPDMAVLEGVVADPAKFKTAILQNQVRPALRQLASGIGASYKAQRESFRAAGGDPEGLPPIYRAARVRAAEAAKKKKPTQQLQFGKGKVVTRGLLANAPPPPPGFVMDN